MRAIWKGAVSFGLVTVPVRLFSATENHDISFRQVRASDGSRIRYKRVAEADGEEVPYSEITKGYETEDGRMVVLTAEELAALPSRSSKEISVEKFVPADQIDPMLFDKSYYLEPDAAGATAYSLLREALRDTDRVAVATIAVRTRMTLALLRVHDDVIVCQTLLWPDEIRAAEFGVLDDVPEPSEQEVKMANLLVDSLASDFEPNEYEDDYAKAVEELVARKIEGQETVEVEKPEEEAGQVVDLLAALQKSVERAKAGRSASSGAGRTGDEEQDSGDSDSTKKSPAKKTAAEKAAPAAKKTAATKTAATKAAASKATASQEAADADETPKRSRKAG